MPTKLGQNFLSNIETVERIVNSAGLSKTETILEIGPGTGILTETLAKHIKQIIAIELDYSLASSLQTKFSNNPKVEIIQDDILKINIPKLLEDKFIKSYKVIANIPYYITSKILRLFLETEITPTEMILMVQKEVAERIVAKPGKMSKLAVSVQYYAKPKILFNVGKENFIPLPKVDSAIIQISDIDNKQFSKNENEKFFKFVRAGFCARRKTLLNNLTNSLHLPKNEIIKKLKASSLSLSVRAQELSVEDWKKLSETL